MSHPIFEKHFDLTPLNDEAATNALLQILVDTPRERLPEIYGASGKAGCFYLLMSDLFPNKVLEYVPDAQQDSSVTTLYQNNSIFQSRQALVDAREEIIAAIDVLLMSVPGTATVFDEGRGNQYRLAELGTAQLLDVLQHFYNH